MSNAAKKSAPASITKAEVTSNADAGKNANLVNGIIRMTYYESILQDSIKANVIFGDVGLAVDNKSVIEGLPLIGTEDFKLQFEDNNENKVRVKMNVNKVTPVYEDGSKNVVSLDLVSEEVLRNEMGESRCRTRENNLISDSIEKIFKDRLKTEKLDIEQSANRYNFIGSGRKPFYMLNLLSKQGVPQGSDGSSAGFLFLKLLTVIISNLLKDYLNKIKRNHIFSIILLTQKEFLLVMMEKVLEHQSDSSINVQSKMNIGCIQN